MNISDLIPAWLVAVSWIYTGFIWIVTRKQVLRIDSTIWGVTFLLVGFLYLSSYLPHERPVVSEVEYLEARILFTRLLMMVLSLSQWLPITVSYFRKVKGNV